LGVGFNTVELAVNVDATFVCDTIFIKPRPLVARARFQETHVCRPGATNGRGFRPGATNGRGFRPGATNGRGFIVERNRKRILSLRLIQRYWG